MPKRRANGEGSIFKRKDGLWAAVYTDNSGKRRTLYGKTQQIVKDKLKEAIKQSDNGLLIDKSKIKLVEWIDEWLEVYAKPTVRESTYALYYRHLTDYVKPHFENIMLKDLRHDMFQKYFNFLAESGKKSGNGGLSNSTVRSIRILLRNILAQAEENNIIIQNPLQKLKIAKVQKMEKEILTLDEQRRLELLILKMGTPSDIAIYLTLYTGLRIGEIIALKETDIDFDKGELSIKRSISKVYSPDNKYYNVSVKETKTEKGNRVIPLPPFITSLLRKYINDTSVLKEFKQCWRQPGKRIPKQIDNAEQFLFLSAYGRPMGSDTLRGTLNRRLKMAGIKHINFHALRHPYVKPATKNI